MASTHPLTTADRDETSATRALLGRRGPDELERQGEAMSGLIKAVSRNDADLVAALLLSRANVAFSSVARDSPELLATTVSAGRSCRALMQVFQEDKRPSMSTQLDALCDLSAPLRREVQEYISSKGNAAVAVSEAGGRSAPLVSRNAPPGQTGMADTAWRTSPHSRSTSSSARQAPDNAEGIREQDEGVTPLVSAVRSGNIRDVMELLLNGADPNAPDALGETALFDAAVLGHTATVNLLLHYHADPDRESLSGVCARKMAASPEVKAAFRRSDVEIANSIERLAAIRTSTSQALELSARYAEIAEMVQKLEEMTRGKAGVMSEPLQRPPPAATRGVKSSPARPYEVGVRAASIDGSDEGTSTSSRLGSKRTCTVLETVIHHDDVAQVQQLLKATADPNEPNTWGETPLFAATEKNSAEMTALLLMHRADPSRQSFFGVLPRDRTKDPAVHALLQLFNSNCKAIEEIDKATLDTAMAGLPMKSQLALGEYLEKLSIQRRGSGSASTARWESGHSNTASAFGDEGRMPSPPSASHAAMPTFSGSGASSQTTLPDAVSAGNLQVVLDMLAARANPNVQDEVGETVLFEAVAHENFDIVAALLVHRADPSTRSDAGMLPASMACSDNMRTVLKAFASRGNLQATETIFSLISNSDVCRAVARFFDGALEQFYSHNESKDEDIQEEAEGRPLHGRGTSEDMAAGSVASRLQHFRMADGGSSSSSRLPADGSKPNSKAPSRADPEDAPPEEQQSPWMWGMGGKEAPRAATAALVQLLRTGCVEGAEQQRALATLDPRTVQVVLTAALQCLEERGVYMRIGPVQQAASQDWTNTAGLPSLGAFSGRLASPTEKC